MGRWIALSELLSSHPMKAGEFPGLRGVIPWDGLGGPWVGPRGPREVDRVLATRRRGQALSQWDTTPVP